MIVAPRKLVLLALFAGSTLLIAAPPARAQSPNPAAQARFVQMLLNRNAKAIQHQFNIINHENSLVSRQQFLANLVPANLPQARHIYQQLQNIGRQIVAINAELEPGKFRLISFINQTAGAISQLNQIVPPNSRFSPFVQQANQTFAQQIAETQQIVNRPPATPFVPSVAANVLGLVPGQPLSVLQVRSSFNSRLGTPSLESSRPHSTTLSVRRPRRQP